ncbi:OpgC family protein [Amaricoccus macauensis]|uniref:OpgC family protein n=1 Tax=Amaricoccus macauensis TaxID=57001 RepID=UPI003C79C1B7
MAHGTQSASGPDAAATVPRPRDPRLDFFRGLAMYIILISHVPSNKWAGWIPGRFGFSDATEIFVFCSGMASAIAFGATFRRAGWFMGTARTLFRIWQVYWAHIGLFFFIAMSMALFDSIGEHEISYIKRLNLTRFFDDTAQQLVGMFTLTYVPNYFDILPMYLVILAMMPFVMILARFDVRLVFAVSIGLWLVANFGYLKLPAEPWSDREWFFNPFGWQLIFFTGFAFMSGWLPRPPVSKLLIGIAIAYLVLTTPFSSAKVVNWLSLVSPAAAEWSKEVYPGMYPFRAKTTFGILRFLHFLALAYVVWVAAGEGGKRLVAAREGVLGRIWMRLLRIITTVGQQSLAVFIFSMLLAQYMGAALDVLGRYSPMIALVNIVGILLLTGEAYLVAWVKGHPWRQKRVVHAHAHEPPREAAQPATI